MHLYVTVCNLQLCVAKHALCVYVCVYVCACLCIYMLLFIICSFVCVYVHMLHILVCPSKAHRWCRNNWNSLTLIISRLILVTRNHVSISTCTATGQLAPKPQPGWSCLRCFISFHLDITVLWWLWLLVYSDYSSWVIFGTLGQQLWRPAPRWVRSFSHIIFVLVAFYLDWPT